MSEQTTGDWMQFFKDAGLPSSIAGNYAVIFVENRIKLEMLMDLSKEYLYDMGIRLMGDVIAILKHAKEYHTELTKERMISSIPGMQQKISPASRMLGRLTKPTSIPKLSLPAALQHGTQSPAVLQTATRRISKPAVISLKKRLGDTREIPVAKRVRRVLPEEEGGYLIKMPSGTTERTRKILQSQMIQIGSKKSVFDRLGDSDVSSSTDILKSKVMSSASVFDRLGSSNEVSTSTISAGKNLSISDQPLQYHGVLKTTAATRITGSSTKIITVSKSMKPTVTSTTSKRVVYSNVKDVQPAGISRINQILTRNATARDSLTRRFGMQSQTPQSTINTRSVLNRLGNKGVSTKVNDASRLLTRGVANRLPSKVNVASRLSTKVDVASRLGSRFGAHAKPQVSVFSRLGK